MTCWRAVWGPMVFEPQESRKKKVIFTKWGVSSRFQTIGLETSREHGHGLHQGTYARRDWQTNFKSPAARSHRIDDLWIPTMGGRLRQLDVPSKMSQIITHFLPTLTCSCLRWLHQIAHLVFAWRSFFYYRFSFFSMAIFRPRKRIIGPLPHAAAGLEASLWRWYPRGARWANACSSGPMDWGVL